MTARPTTTVRVIAFPGAPNLPTFVALEHGFFADEGLDVELTLTPSSIAQAERTAAGVFDIIFTAFDNVVAYAEGQGAAGAGVDPQYVVIAGATQLELSLVTAPEVESYTDLKDRSVALDALSTGFAFVLLELMARGGLQPDDVRFAAVGATPQRWQSVKAGDHAGTLTIEPFTSIARAAGYNVLDSSSRHFEAYQGGVIATRRPWAAENPLAVRAFIKGYLRGLRWTLDPANVEAAEVLLTSKMREIQPAAVKPVMRSLLSPGSGLTPEAEVLPDGMRRVLDLRSRYGKAQVPLNTPDKYLDLSHYEAVATAR